MGTDIPAIRGDVVAPADPEWDTARQAWNLAADQRPALVVVPVDAADVVAIVEFARSNGLRVAAQGTGHNARAIGSLDDTILLATRSMRGVEIDAEARIARVHAGTLTVEVAEAATEVGLFPLLGSGPDVGVVGYTLGGGLSWLGRKHGLAANHVTAVEVVTPDGELRRTTQTEHPELFWALRGGGGSFGVVTALEYGLLPYGELYAGMFMWPFERHAEVLAAWHGLTRSAPDELTTWFRLLHLPPLEEVPPFLRGRSVVVIDGIFVGDTADGEAAVAELRRLEPEMDTWGPMTAAAVSHLHMDPEQPTPYASDATLLGELDDAGLEAFAGAVQPGAPLLFGELRHLGGALARAPEGAGALGALPGDYSLLGIGILMSPDAAGALEEGLQGLRGAMAGYETGRSYANFVERPVDPATLFARDDYERLQAVRSAVDPDGMMAAAHTIPAGRNP
jgi:FAD/FMN-containing dehydrogenase